jgi:integral membrane protein (TIGR01906 family)
MKKKTIIIIISVLLVLFLSDIVYITSFKVNAFNEEFYSKEFEKYGVYGEFPGKDVDKINSELLLYLRDKKDDYNKELFNQEEVEHLRDVKVLIAKIDVYYYFILIFSILLIASLFLLDKKSFLRNSSFVLFFSGVFTLFFVVILLVLMMLNFDGFFTFFHKLFFPQGGWLFSSSDNIIKLYPFGFFYDIAKRIFLNIVLYANILILAGVSLFFWKK